MNKILLVVSLLSTLSLVSCQTSAPAVRKPEPLTPPEGKPLKVSILGATYKVPKDLSVDDHLREPGRFVLDFTDKVTGCKGYSLFRTTGDAEVHKKEIKEISDETERDFKAEGVEVKSAIENVSIPSGAVRVNKLTLKTDSDAAGGALLDAHLKDSQLSLIGYIFCSDPTVLPKSLKTLTTMYSSRTADKADDE